jgi:hypothetical protein
MKTKITNILIVLIFITAVYNTAMAQKLTLQFTDMAVHSGETLFIRVWDKNSGIEVGRDSLTVPGATFEVPLYVIAVGSSYWVDFFADHNKNNKYDAPPTDHAWRLGIDGASADVTLAFKHNTNFTDIQWPDVQDWSDYLGTWEGYWMNLTYKTTAPLTIVGVLTPDKKTLRMSLSTSGMFGNPAPFYSYGEMPWDSTADKIIVPSSSTTLTGQYDIVRGNVHAALNAASVGVTLTLLGHWGSTQAIVAYTMSGTFNANGIIFLTKSSSTDVNAVEGIQIPAAIELAKNYPNPFNASTTIEFSLAQRTRIKLSVFDILGNSIATLADGVFDSGIHRIVFDASALPSGLYYYSLEANNHLLVEKMTLLK